MIRTFNIDNFPYWLRFFLATGLMLLILSHSIHSIAFAQGWDDIKIRLLPDTSFALIEYDVGKPVRHCPYRDLNGRLDIDQLIYVLGTLDLESWINPANKEIAKKHLEKHYHVFLKKAQKNFNHQPFNINEARLSDFVKLPLIGPVTAVRIVNYRESHLRYQNIEELKKIDGIGPGIFTAIRHYVIVE